MNQKIESSFFLNPLVGNFDFHQLFKQEIQKVSTNLLETGTGGAEEIYSK